MTTAASKTAKTLAQRSERESRTSLSGIRRAKAKPARARMIQKTGAECLAPRVKPRAIAHPARSGQRQVRNARAARTMAVAESSATGRSVMTIGRCAATVGSMARNKRVARATMGPKTRRSAREKTSKRIPLKILIAMRA